MRFGSRSRRWSLLALLTSASVGIAACGPARDRDDAAAAAQGPPPNVVLIVLDTVRADHLSSYGYPRETTPRIDAVAAVADRYSAARATAPWTVPSHASMLTGLWPFEHGAQARFAGGRVREFPLDPAHLTLAEALTDRGYRTGAFVANRTYLGPRSGFAQGFGTYRGVRAEAPEAGGRADVTAAALRWLDAAPAEAPYFLFLNYMEAHRPYHVAPLPPDRAAALPTPDPVDPSRLLDRLVAAVLDAKAPPPPALVQRVVDQYDVGLAHADLAVGALVDGLRARGDWDRTLVIITSDHGEYFGEHDLVEHSKDVYEEALAVPLIVKRPGQVRGRVLDERFSLAGLPALVAGAVGGPVGEALAALFPVREDDVAFAELRYTRRRDLYAPYGARFRRVRTAVYHGRHKAILSSDGEHALYDLTADPREQHNLYRADRSTAAALFERARAARRRGASPPGGPPPREFSDEERAHLRVLGYVE